MATRTVTAVFTINSLGRLVNAQTSAGESGESAKGVFGENNDIEFTGGVGANQAQRAWASEGRTLSASTEDIDLFDFGSLDIGGGAGKDQLGGSMALTGIKMLYIKNRSTSAADLVVGGKGASTAWTSLLATNTFTITLKPGQILMTTDPSAAGMAVADTTNHLLTMTSGGACTYDIALIGI